MMIVKAVSFALEIDVLRRYRPKIINTIWKTQKYMFYIVKLTLKTFMLSRKIWIVYTFIEIIRTFGG